MYPCPVVLCWNWIIYIVHLGGVQFSSPFLRQLHSGISWSSRRMFGCSSGEFSGSCAGRLLQVMVCLNTVLFSVTKNVEYNYRTPLLSSSLRAWVSSSQVLSSPYLHKLKILWNDAPKFNKSWHGHFRPLLKKCWLMSSPLIFVYDLTVDITPVAIYCRQNRYGTSARRTSYRRSLQPSKDNIQHFKTWKFFAFSIFVGLFSLLVPDLDPHSKCESGSNSSNSNGSQDAVLEIRDIFVRIWIPASAPLTNGSVSELWIWLLFHWYWY